MTSRATIRPERAGTVDPDSAPVSTRTPGLDGPRRNAPGRAPARSAADVFGVDAKRLLMISPIRRAKASEAPLLAYVDTAEIGLLV
jgi:hypothetical protein